MSATRISSFVLVLWACIAGAVQAQGPWPTMNRPSFYSPFQEFTPTRSMTMYDSQPQYLAYPGTTIVPGVPQCANGRCRTSCPNGQCTPSNTCPGGQCGVPSQNYYGPGNTMTGGHCANGQCGTVYSGNRLLGLPAFQPSRPASSFGFRPLTPSQPTTNPQYRGSQVNRLIPLESVPDTTRGDNVVPRPIYRERESMIPASPDVTNHSTVRLQ